MKDEKGDSTSETTRGWQPLELVKVKKVPAVGGMEKLLIFSGAWRCFRSRPAKTYRLERAAERKAGKGFGGKTYWPT